VRVAVATLSATLGEHAVLTRDGLVAPSGRLRPGDLHPVEVEGFQVGLLAGEHCWLPEAARLLQLRGAHIICFLPRPARSEWDRLAGPWNLIQATQLYGVEAAPEAPRILAPCELTPDGSGILGRTAELTRQVLPDTFRRWLRPDFYLRHLPW
jgi:hypothetical protein